MASAPSAPFHAVAGRAITAYLDIISDPPTFGSVDNILAQIDRQWRPICSAHNITLTIALGPGTAAPATTTFAGITVVAPSATAPPNARLFTLQVGRGANALAVTRSGRVSYTTLTASTGYIYIEDARTNDFTVPAMSHELGHILGLADRYYEGAYWLGDHVIDRTCRQIRQDVYPPVGNSDVRDGLRDTTALTKKMPALAVRQTLPMAKNMVPAENGYDPVNNLMSTSTSILTHEQVDVILSRLPEPPYRGPGWVAILGAWKRRTGNQIPIIVPTGALGTGLDTPPDTDNNDQWPYPAWEAGPNELGRGLVFVPAKLQPNKGFNRYPCVSPIGAAQDDLGVVVDSTRLQLARGKKRLIRFVAGIFDIKVGAVEPNPMCHMRKLINDLMQV